MRDNLGCRVKKPRCSWLYYRAHLSSQTVHEVKPVKRTQGRSEGGGGRGWWGDEMEYLVQFALPHP